FAVGYQKPRLTHYVLQVNTTPLFAVGYHKPQQTHYVQPVKTTPLFAVGYLKPYQIPDACSCKKTFVPNRIQGFSGRP
ncbi:hypothetical protein ACUU0T_25785, partial [Klebsiella pneumoniae]